MTSREARERNLIIAAVAAVVLVIAGGLAYQSWRTHRAPTVSAGLAGSGSASGSGGASLAPVTITDGKPIVLGHPEASVTVTLYEDFHCPHCAEFEETFGPTVTAAQNAGTARVELFPMAFVDSGSTAAANAMACAAEAGFGQSYYVGLFANHTLQWSNAQLITLADQITGDTTPDSFQPCVEQQRHADWVNSINAAADAAGVDQTPTMFVAGAPMDISSLTVDALNTLIADAASAN